MSYYGHASAAKPTPTTPSFHSTAGAAAAIDAAKIFVGGLSWQTTEETLRYHFEQYGEVASVEVMRDRNTGDPRGFAFVVFKTDETVDLILKNKPHEINHKVVDVKRAQARGIAPPSIHGAEVSSAAYDSQEGEQQSSSRVKQEDGAGGGGAPSPEELKNKVFVGGLPLHVDKDGLKEFFSCFGPVTDAIVMMDMVQHRSRGFGFITFENGSGGAQKAIESQPINMFGKMVEVKLATPKGGGGGGGGGGGPSFGNPNHHRRPLMTQTSSTGEFAGLASSYGRAGWRAGYGSKAFGKAGWSVVGWDDGGDAPEKSGFSFSLLDKVDDRRNEERPAKRPRQ
ncbi:hypothetical protein ACHAXR_007706 [Thalassiosira sp. AJA248-18]